MSSSGTSTPNCTTIQIYEDSETSDYDISVRGPAPAGKSSFSSPGRWGYDAVEDSRDGSETEVVEEGEEGYDESIGGLKQLGLAKSIEREDSVFEVGSENALGRNFSSTTAIHLEDELDDPFMHDGDYRRLDDVEEESTDADREFDEYEDDEYDRDAEGDDDMEDYSVHSGAGGSQADSRHVSDFSTVPDEVDNVLPAAPTPPVWSQRGFRHTAGSPSSPARSSNRLLSSPQNSSGRHFSPSTSNHRDGRFVSSPLARQSSSSSAFRNSSSVRAMQLSSPSSPASPGFAHSPRSARQRRLGLDGDGGGSSRNGTPFRTPQLRHSSRVMSSLDGSPIPSKHPHVKKEYPLVLLHCSFSSPPLPYSPSAMRAVLPDEIQESITLLREKLGLTVLERGILIPHPGEDYELLEERILESLELKTPRVGKCGHFLGPDGSRMPSAKNREEEDGAADAMIQVALGDAESLANPKCEICTRPVADRHRGCEGDSHRRWDIRVYASNGLMRAGAWSAAWREMEKVDVEISVWLDEEISVALEHEAQAEFERDGAHDDHFAYDLPLDESDGLRQPARGEPFAPPPQSNYSKADMRSASTAACSRPSSRHHNRRHAHDERLPLSTLFLNFIKRTCTERTELFLQILVVALAFALFKQWQSPATSPGSSMLDVEMSNPETVPRIIPIPQASHDGPESASLANSAATHETTIEENEEKRSRIPACTFTAGAEAEAGMTAVPADIAQMILNSATLPAETNSETKAEAPPIDETSRSFFAVMEEAIGETMGETLIDE